MQALIHFRDIFEALSNEKRLEIFSFIQENLFIAKSDLLIQFNLNRATLNHHLKYLIEANLVREQEMMIEGHKQYFIFSTVEIDPNPSFFQTRNDLDSILSVIDHWSEKNLTLGDWQDLRENLHTRIQTSPLLYALENRLFDSIQKLGSFSKKDIRCTICKSSNVEAFCYKCHNPICAECAHKINHEQIKEIFCRNCVEQLFS